jgi:pyruvate/2-oxoglutarate dehydrogenase complex dihydrolipoamide dehydrogenase (E3) component
MVINVVYTEATWEEHNMTKMDSYDAVVIGAGQGGTPLATSLANSGWKTALVEKAHVGGTCINEGCTPTKTMVASARVAYLGRRAHDFGVSTGTIEIDMKKIRKRKNDMVHSFRSGSENRIHDAENLDLIMGSARFNDAHSLSVYLNSGGQRKIGADRIFINTGSRPRVPELSGIADVPYLDSTSIMELDSIPGHLLIIGGGYIGLEFAQMFRRFGSDVTIVHRGPQLLMREDDDVAEEVLSIMRGDGIDVLMNSTPTAVKVFRGSWIELTVAGEEGEKGISGSHLLIAAGRVPNTDDLNLQAAGVETDKRGFIRVNERLETSTRGIYAMGDVKGGPAFTHISYDDFRILYENLTNRGHRSTDNRMVPYTVFIDPQLGRIGLNEKEAASRQIPYKVASMPMSWVARALELDEPRGLMKALVHQQNKQILGAAILGIEGGEIMAMVQIAMMGKLPYTVLKDAVFAHPTLSESLNNLFSTVA